MDQMLRVVSVMGLQESLRLMETAQAYVRVGVAKPDATASRKWRQTSGFYQSSDTADTSSLFDAIESRILHQNLITWLKIPVFCLMIQGGSK